MNAILEWTLFSESPGTEVNPATGLPMIGDDIGGIDVFGNPYGMNLHSDDAFGAHSPLDAFDSTSAFDHDCGSGTSWDL